MPIARNGLCLFTSAFVLSATGATAAMVPVGGIVDLFWAEFTSEIDGVDLTIDGAIFNTGPISVYLDKSVPPSQRAMTIDFDRLTHEYSIPILLEAPLFGDEVQSATFEFMGPILNLSPTMIPDDAASVLTFSFDSFGGGTFGPGNSLEGWTYSNIFNTTEINVEVKDSEIRVLSPDTDVDVNVQGEIRGTLSPPADCPNCGSAVQITGTDAGKIAPIPLPAPVFTLMAGMGLLSLWSLRRSKTT